MPLEVILIVGGIIVSILGYGYYRLAKVAGKIHNASRAGERQAGGRELF